MTLRTTGDLPRVHALLQVVVAHILQRLVLGNVQIIQFITLVIEEVTVLPRPTSRHFDGRAILTDALDTAERCCWTDVAVLAVTHE